MMKKEIEKKKKKKREEKSAEIQPYVAAFLCGSWMVMRADIGVYLQAKTRATTALKPP